MAPAIRTLLVDDEPLSLDYLASLLEEKADIVVAGRCRNGREALARLRQGDIDLVLLDVQMPGMTGLEVIANLQSDAAPLVIFATAYDRFAIEAFDLNAVDYLLKPFDPERVDVALDRVRERWAAQAILGADKAGVVGALAKIRRGAGSGEPEPKSEASSAQEFNKLPIKDGQQTYLVSFDDIDWIDAAGDYMCVHAGGQTHILRSTMKELDQKLSGQFVRIHRSTIVNLAKVDRVKSLPKGESLLHLKDDVTLKVSRNFRSSISHLLTG